MSSIDTLLKKAASQLSPVSESALLEAEILLCAALNKTRSHLRAWPDKPVSADDLEVFRRLIQSRQDGTPIAYIIGQREFWSRDFIVTSDVLIPRPETELLIELCLQLIPENHRVNVLDLGTGSGIIAVTVAAERPLADVVASDLSLPALSVAKRNAEKHEIGNITFYHSDWFADMPHRAFDLVVSNPPYIQEGDSHLAQGDLRFEPKNSLCAEQEGLSDILQIAEHARQWLQPEGHLLIEHGYDQQFQVQTIFRDFGYKNVKTHADLSNHPRATSGTYRE
ncbi:MAG: peptide chain release factor N(5)-glutamine methyltransferase [Gammaproteobacteria bacterium]